MRRGRPRSPCSSPTTRCSSARACGRCSQPQPDLEVVGRGRGLRRPGEGRNRATDPHVVVTDIRMPPSFQNEGIEAAKLVRMRNPGTGVVVLSQYDEPEYAISLLSRGRGRVRVSAEGSRRRRRPARARGPRSRDRRQHARSRDRRARWSRRPVATASSTSARTNSSQWIAEGRPVKAIAAALESRPRPRTTRSKTLFLKLAKEASAGREGALRRLRLLAEGDRRPRGARRDAAPAAAGRVGGEAAHATAATSARRERLDGHRADVGRPRLLRHRRARRPDGARRAAERRTAPR